MRTKAALSCLLVFTLVAGLLGAAPGRATAQTGVEEVVPVNLGSPVQTAQVIDAQYGVEDGANVAYTTVTGSASAGDYATFSVIDIDNEKLLRQFKLEGASNAWNHVKTPDGRVFIGASQKMFMYSPETKQITDLGVPLPNTSSVWSLAADEHGNVYGGIYSETAKSRIFRIDAKTLQITDLLNKPVDVNEAYIRSMDYHNGYIYAGTGSANGRVWKISTTNPQADVINLGLAGTPDDPVYKGLYDKMGFVYGLDIHENYLFAFYNGPSIMQVYDLTKQEWTQATFENIRGVEAATGYKDGKVYTSKKDGKMWEINLVTLSEREAMPFNNNIRHSEWMTVKNQPEFPNGAMVSVNFDGKVLLMDPVNQKIKPMQRLVEGQGINLQALETGPDGKLYMSTYLNSEAAQYDPATGQFNIFPLGQAEGIGAVGDTLYFGLYPKAEIAAWDTKTPLPTKHPEILFNIGESQDRPFIVTEGDGKLLLGTIPGYSEKGGALTIYDPAASKASGKPEFEVFRNVVQDQSITGLVYRNGLIFGSTSIAGGLGGTEPGMRAKLFVWDVANKKKLYEWEPELEGLSSLNMISGLTIGPDGLIWASANGIVFALDPDTRKVVKSRNIHPDITVYGKWRPVHQRFTSDGLLYSDAGERLVIIDPETMAYKKIRDKASLYTLDRNDNLYVADATRLLKYPPFPKPIEPEKPQEPTKVFLDIQNPGFEETVQADGTIPGWTVTASTYGVSVTEVTDQNKLTGSRSLKLVDASTVEMTEIMSNPVPVIPGRKYTANFNMFLNGSFPRPDPNEPPFSSSRSSVGIRYFDGDNKMIPITSADNRHVQGPQHSWIPLEMETKAPANAVTMRLVLFASPLWVSTTHYDDMSVYTLIEASEMPVITSTEWASRKVTEGSDAKLAVKATDQSRILIKENGKIVAEGKGAGQEPVTITIPAPSRGVHHYTIEADIPNLIAGEKTELPVLQVKKKNPKYQ